MTTQGSTLDTKWLTQGQTTVGIPGWSGLTGQGFRTPRGDFSEVATVSSALGGEEQIREADRAAGWEPRWGPSLSSQLAPQVLSPQMLLTPLRPLCLFPAHGEFPGINTGCLAKQCRPGSPHFLPEKLLF